MKVINLDILTQEEAKIIFKGKEYIIKEPTLKDWAYFLKINQKEEGKKLTNQDVIDICEILIPSLFIENDNSKPIDNFTESEFLTLYQVVVIVFNGGIKDLGKKKKPLHQIIKEI